MGTLYFLGRAPAVAQVDTGSIDSVDGTPANNTFTVTVGGVAISQVGDTDVATTAAALVVLLNASTHPYFAAVTWTNPSAGNIVGTADVAGCPFVAVLSETGAGTGAVTDFAGSTASSGPNDWSTAANWDTGAVPVAGDDVVLRDSDVSICYGLAQQAVDLNSLVIEGTYTGRIGLRYQSFSTSADGGTMVATADEYRPHYLDIESDEVRIGEHYGPGRVVGSSRIKLDLGVHACSVVVHSTSRNPAETGKACVRLLMDNSSSTVYVRKAEGGVGIAADEAGETSTVGEVSVAWATAGTFVHVAEGVTLTTWRNRGGTCVLQAAATVTAVQLLGGSLEMEGAYLATTVTVDGGVLYPNNAPAAGAAITTLVNNGGHVDASRSTKPRTWTTVQEKVRSGATHDIDPAIVTMTNELELVS